MVLQELFYDNVYYMMLLGISGCSNKVSDGKTDAGSKERISEKQQEIQKDKQEIGEICRLLYEKADKEGSMSDVEITRSIIDQLGKKGYPAVDDKNQMNMNHADLRKQNLQNIHIQRLSDIRKIVMGRLH